MRLAPPTPSEVQSSPWAPLRDPLFRGIWLATVASNFGTWIHEVAAGWLMTSLTPEPFLVSLVQAATGLPMFFLALPAGALADVLDRRRILLVTQTWMMLGAIGLGVATALDAVTPWVLLGFTALLGLGTAFNAPAWQASVPEVAPAGQLPAAVALNSLSFNLARAAGPAIGGLLLATLGATANFLLNAASFVAVLVVLARWRRPPRESLLPSERFFGALRTGARYVRHAPALRAVLVRGGVFVAAGSALWALLPLVARIELGGGPGEYGALLGAFGSGAVAGAANLHRLRRRFGFDRLAAVATLVFAAALVVLAATDSVAVAAVALFAAGGGWLSTLSGFNVAAQTAVPSWVRARALASYLVVFYGAMAGGSMLWGALAGRVGTSAALVTAAAGLVAGLLAMLRYPLTVREAGTLAPSRHWPAPFLASEPEADRGPVLVSVEYLVAPERAVEFARVMQGVRESRRRSGAIRWGLWADASVPGRYLETFVDESWLEHLRHHERVTAEDRDVEAAARAFHLGEEAPRVSHFLAERPLA